MEKLKKQRRNDRILFACILAAALFSYVFLGSNRTFFGANVVVKSEGKTVYTLPLKEDTSITVKNSHEEENTVVIKNGVVKVQNSTCKNHDCEKITLKKGSGNVIVCLPNKLIVEIVNDENDLDGVM